MLAVFDLPLVTHPLEQLIGPGLIGPETGHFVSNFFGVFDDLTGPDFIDLALNADQLCCASQTQGLRIDLANPQCPVFHSTVFLFDGPGCRGEKRP